VTAEIEVQIGLCCPECEHEFILGMSTGEAMEHASMLAAAARFDPTKPFELAPLDGRLLGVRGGSDGLVG
jgi:hypothetical protein